MLRFSISLPLTLAALALTLAARALMPSASPANLQPAESQIIRFENELEPKTETHGNPEPKTQLHGNPEPEPENLIYGDAEAYPHCPVCK